MIRSEVKTITPAQAQTMLGYSKTKNRVLNKSLVKQLADDMAGGRYMLNGESVIISTDGDVIDGHHRLTACVKAGVPFQTVIVSGVNADVMPTVDTGDGRDRADVLQFAGVKNAQVVAAVCKMVWHAERDQLSAYRQGARVVGFTNAVLLDVLSRHHGIHEAVNRGDTHHRQFPPVPRATFSFLSYWLLRYDAAVAGDFLNKLAEGNGLLASCPVAMVRNRLIEDAARKSSKLPPIHKLALVIKAWRFFARGDSVRYLKWVENEPFPNPDPMA